MPTYSVTLDSYTPSARAAAAGVWNRVRWEQGGASRTGPFTALDTQTVDFGTDPTAPETVEDITTELATVHPGWFRLVALDAQGVEEPTEAFYAGSAVRPTVQEVARLMPDRATATSGAGLPNFDATTEPTADAVDGLIDIVLDSVDPHVPAGATPEVQRAARNVVTLTTAILTETGYFGEQRDVNDAKVRVWEAMLASNQAILDAAAQDDQPGGVRFGSIPVVSPTVGAWQRQAGLIGTELLP